MRTLPALNSLRDPGVPWELVIVNNASNDHTAEILRQTGWQPQGLEVRICDEHKLGLSHARNRALDEARGEYILFMDDDETPDPNWLVAFVTTMRAQQPDALGGRIEVLFEDGARPTWLQDELLGFLGQLDHGPARQLSDPTTPIFGGNFAFNRKIFATIGRFDIRLGRQGTVNVGGEDTEIYRRLLTAGSRVWWVPDAVIHHRIQTPKLRRSYFLDLHYRQGRSEGGRQRGHASRVPPRYLWPQLMRAYYRALKQRLRLGADYALRLEMNAAYFTGFILGWCREP